MNSKEIKAIITKELNNQVDQSNVYGLNLNQCLIEPLKQRYESSVDSKISFDLWTVLEESKDKQGYKVTFDQDDRTFGLGILTQEGELLDIGSYDTFIEAIKGM